MSPSPRAALGLYRSLLRYARSLELSDRDYVQQRIRKEFELSRRIANQEEIARKMRKGQALLERRSLV